MPDETWERDDLPGTYWILATLHGFKFVLDVGEGERVGGLLTARREGNAAPEREQFLRFLDYTGAPAYVQFDYIDCCYLSTPSARAFDDAITTDRKKRGWGEAGDE